MNELERVCALLRAAPVVRMLRDGGVSFEDMAIKNPKTANPLGLSPRQLARIYEGDDSYSFTRLRDAVRRLDWTKLDTRKRA